MPETAANTAMYVASSTNRSLKSHRKPCGGLAADRETHSRSQFVVQFHCLGNKCGFFRVNGAICTAGECSQSGSHDLHRSHATVAVSGVCETCAI